MLPLRFIEKKSCFPVRNVFSTPRNSMGRGETSAPHAGKYFCHSQRVKTLLIFQHDHPRLLV